MSVAMNQKMRPLIEKAKSSPTSSFAGQTVSTGLSSDLQSQLQMEDSDMQLYMKFLPENHREDWVKWAEADHCYLCALVFSKMSINKHRTHCRKCGNSVCKFCSQN